MSLIWNLRPLTPEAFCKDVIPWELPRCASEGCDSIRLSGAGPGQSGVRGLKFEAWELNKKFVGDEESRQSWGTKGDHAAISARR